MTFTEYHGESAISLVERFKSLRDGQSPLVGGGRVQGSRGTTTLLPFLSPFAKSQNLDVVLNFLPAKNTKRDGGGHGME